MQQARPRSPFPIRKSLLAAAIATVAIGCFWWFAPYGSLDVFQQILPFSLIPLAVAAIFATSDTPTSIMIACMIGASGPVAVILRIIVEVAGDPTSHNLWPFEIVMAGMVTLPAAIIGGLVGFGFKRKSGRQPRRH